MSGPANPFAPTMVVLFFPGCCLSSTWDSAKNFKSRIWSRERRNSNWSLRKACENLGTWSKTRHLSILEQHVKTLITFERHSFLFSRIVPSFEKLVLYALALLVCTLAAASRMLSSALFNLLRFAKNFGVNSQRPVSPQLSPIAAF